jgi:NarL family two-component system sensor histidine kinase LiaS
VVVVDPELYIVTTLPKLAGGVPAGLRLDETVAPFLSSLASQALTSDKVLDETSPNHISYAIPVIDKSGELYGAVILSIDPAQLSRQALSTLLLTAGGILLVFTLLAGAVGTLFGFVAARGLTRRLNRLAQASAAWRKGDFSVVAADRSGDEISNLASDLNYMAAELKTLFNYRQELAAVEERSRIARDLHDSVKQQAFAVAAQVSAGRSLLHRDPQAAEARLQEAERLNDSLRQELGMLVRELHGGDVLAQGLPAGLRELAAGWERQQIFTVSCEIHGDPVLPSNAQLALYRVAQEALANATRHSRASQVQLTLNSYSDRVELEIADNGQGFDPQTAAHGLGLDSMRRRMSDLDGELRIESAPGQGTRVIATVRLSGESNG